MIGAIIVLAAASVAEICSNNWRAWLGAAILVRSGVGLAPSTLITYVSEISPFQIRGFMIASYQLLLGVGQLISAVVSQNCRHLETYRVEAVDCYRIHLHRGISLGFRSGF